MNCYYAHPITSYNSAEEKDDIATLERLGLVVINPNNSLYEAAYRERGMIVFTELVDTCEVLAFRAFDSGDVPAGVAKEIVAAQDKKKTIIELGLPHESRILSVADTRAELVLRGRK